MVVKDRKVVFRVTYSVLSRNGLKFIFIKEIDLWIDFWNVSEVESHLQT